MEIEGSSVTPEILMYDSVCYACTISPSTSCTLKDVSISKNFQKTVAQAQFKEV